MFWLWCAYRILGPNSFWIGNNNPNKYYYFFAGYHDTKYARSYDLWHALAHLVVGFMFGFLIYNPLAQIIVIVSILSVLLIILILLRPWKSTLLNIGDIISSVCILVCVIIFLVYTILDEGSCIGCGDREGRICWVVMLFFWLGLVIGLILLWLAVIRQYFGTKVDTSIHEESYYHVNKIENV